MESVSVGGVSWDTGNGLWELKLTKMGVGGVRAAVDRTRRVEEVDPGGFDVLWDAPGVAKRSAK